VHGGYGLAAQARTVVAYLEHRAAGPVHLVGNSMGGVATLLVAATRPDLVRTLTLISPAMPSLRPRRGSDIVMPLLLLPGIGRYAQRRLDALPPQRRAAGLIRICFADPAAVPRNRVDEAIAEIARRRELPWATDAFTAALRGLARSYLVLGPRSLWKQAGLVRAPTLVVWGSEDQLVPVELAGRTAASVPDSRLLVPERGACRAAGGPGDHGARHPRADRGPRLAAGLAGGAGIDVEPRDTPRPSRCVAVGGSPATRR